MLSLEEEGRSDEIRTVSFVVSFIHSKLRNAPLSNAMSRAMKGTNVTAPSRGPLRQQEAVWR